MNVSRYCKAGLVLSMAMLFTACGFVDTGNVGVRTQFGNTELVEEGQGFYTNVLSSLDIFTFKQIAIDIDNLTPKAKDNLSLQDLDFTVYYNVKPEMIADLSVKYKGQSARNGTGDEWKPMYVYVKRQATSAIEKEIANVDSLEIHQERDIIETATKERLQALLDQDDEGVFKIERVTITRAITDSTIEESIQQVVQAQKENEAMTFKINTAQKQAELNNKLNTTYTAAYLRHEYNVALSECAVSEHCTMIVGATENALINIR
jgi:regulator of protease activity HflC (stomatin/prohibitin superfamily)